MAAAPSGTHMASSSGTQPLLPAAIGPSPLESAKRKLLIGTALCFAFMLAEVAGGILAHSLAVMTDAAHMLSDVAGFLVSVLSLILSSRKATPQFSFGYHRAEVIGALASISVVWVMTGILVIEATARLITPEPVDGAVMFWIALLGIAMNLVLMRVLEGGGDDDGGPSFAHGHSHSHGHSHGHGHNGKPKRKKKKPAYQPPPLSHEHSHTPHAHDLGHDHSHAGSGGGGGGMGKARAHGHDHAHSSSSKGHGHDHADVESHGHDHHGHDHHGHDHHSAHEHEHDPNDCDDCTLYARFSLSPLPSLLASRLAPLSFALLSLPVLSSPLSPFPRRMS